MIKDIMRDPLFLAARSEPATAADAPVAADLADTLRANQARCVGMAANMIGERKRIIAFVTPYGVQTMYNPQITKAFGEYEAEEGCLSLEGVRRAKRYKAIEVSWQDRMMKKHKQKFEGFTAQIIQHEIDHCEGILI